MSRQMGEVRGGRMSMSECDAACGFNSLGGTRMGRDAKSMQLTDASSRMKRDAIQTLNFKKR